MMRLALGLLALFAVNAHAIDVNPSFSGSWFNPDQNGHGFSVEVLPDGRTIIYWYVYHPDGTPTFIIGIGENVRNRVEAEAFYSTGMKFGEFDPADRTQVPWGTLTLSFGTCNSAVLEYDSTLNYDGVPWGSGSIPLTRLATIDGLECSPVPEAGIYEGPFLSNLAGEPLPGYAILADNREFVAVGFDGFVIRGDWTTRGVNLDADGTGVSAVKGEEFTAAAGLGGQILAGYRMLGTWSITGIDSGSYDLLAVPEVYRRGATLADLAGTYTAQNLVTGETGTATISATGNLDFTGSLNCVYDGQIGVPDTNFNLLTVDMTLTKCGNANGNYDGYGTRIDYFTLGDSRVVRLITADDEAAVLIDLYR